MPTLTFLGHACCEARAGETRVLFDPFLTGNPLAAIRPEDLTPTAILITHAHNDHLGDAAAIARRSGALVVSTFEIATFLEHMGLKAHGMHIGGSRAFNWGRVKLTPAWHGSTYLDEHGFHPLGTPAGFLLTLEGRTLYHAGDTALFGDMQLIGRAGIDLALLPIGDNYTMGPDDAVEAVKLLRPRAVVPIHYNTFPVIEQDPKAFAARVARETDARCIVLNPGESTEF
ncbi:MAG: metal-dependent hydrolase [Armatimonadetes bacterium]|nr:metal-dependent hydrolase [Armatimonadota bacterium]